MGISGFFLGLSFYTPDGQDRVTWTDESLGLPTADMAKYWLVVSNMAFIFPKSWDDPI